MYDWRAFNFIYLVVYPKDREKEVTDILGPNADLHDQPGEHLNLALRETQSVQGQSLAFAYFNLGSAHVSRLEYVDAAFALRHGAVPGFALAVPVVSDRTVLCLLLCRAVSGCDGSGECHPVSRRKTWKNPGTGAAWRA